MCDLNEQILEQLASNESLDTLEYAKAQNLDHQKVIGAIKSIQTFEKVIKVEQRSFKVYQLNDEAQSIVKNGSHEAVIFKSIPEGGILQSELMVND
jgi:phenylalanyl-tRNA synthetase alpha chain